MQANARVEYNMSNEKMEFEKVFVNNSFYWTWRDISFMPYGWIEEKEVKELPVPFYLEEIHPECRVGFESEGRDALTNIIELPKNFEELKLDSDLRKDLRRIEKKNAETRIEFNEKDALEKSKQWFIKMWDEEKKDLDRRIFLWKNKAYTLSAYVGRELVGVHIAIEEQSTVYYLGCWWNKEYRNLSIPTFLLKKDIERAIEFKKKYYDLGIGSEEYKKKWGIIEKPTKYFAVLTKELAEKMGVKKFVEMK